MNYDSLYIIGNGFDLKHQIHSSYNDFLNWLIGNYRFDVIVELQRICPITENGRYLLWSNFEKALENIEIKDVVEWDWENLLVAETTMGSFLIGNTQPFLDTQISEVIINAFTPWIRSIVIDSKPIVKFENDSFFLTFNYTDTLEKVYGISESKILHIHGRASTDANLIVGHRNFVDPVQHMKFEADFRKDNHRIENVCDYNKLYKPIEEIIENNHLFFEKLSNVKSIVVMGHSCDKIDKLYFQKVSNCVSKDAHWRFFWHNEEHDIPNIKSMIEYLELNTIQFTLEYN